MCSTYKLDKAKCEKDSRGAELKNGEWLPFCAIKCPCGFEYGVYNPPIASTCYSTPAEGKGWWVWCCIVPVFPMGGIGDVEVKDGALLFEHGHHGPFHGGLCCLRGSWSGKGYMAKAGGAPAKPEEMQRASV